MYGFPYEDYEQFHVRKYGFHGTSHRFVTAKLAEIMGKDLKDLKVVSCHLAMVLPLPQYRTASL